MTSTSMTAISPGGTSTLAGHVIARIGYGAMQLGHRLGGTPVDRATAVAVLRRARELGVDHIDTAAFYGDAVASAIRRWWGNWHAYIVGSSAQLRQLVLVQYMRYRWARAAMAAAGVR